MILLLKLAVLFKCVLALTVESPMVCINDGCVRGIIKPGYQTESYEAFIGIPYAAPPIGDLRFADPIPVKPWNSTIDAVTERICIQKNYLVPEVTIFGDEDCLYLNVYRPRFSQQSLELLPVMVYIHGGGFFSGASGPSFIGPEYFMDTSDVILVSIAYRLGAFGFLTSGDDVISGNYGFKDQSFALKWVNKNIRAFGGDPNCVTIFGQSAGGSSVHFHMLSPLSKDLFHRAIIMSGSAITPYIKPVKNPLEQTKLQAKYSGIKNAENLNSSQLLNELRKLDPKVILDGGDGLKVWSIDPLVVFRVAIENPNNPKSFITKHPKKISENGEFNFVPLMMTYVKNEGAVRGGPIITNKTLVNDFNSKFDFVFSTIMEIDANNENELKMKSNKIIDFYLNGKHKIDESNEDNFVKIFGDRAFNHPFYKTYTQYVKHANPLKYPTNLMHFNFNGPLSYSLLFTGSTKDFGVTHCDDLLYLFQSPALFMNPFDKNSLEAKMIHNLVKTYINFAKTGEPIQWSPTRPCISDCRNTCDLQEVTRNELTNSIDVTTNSDFDMEMIKLWDEVDL